MEAQSPLGAAAPISMPVMSSSCPTVKKMSCSPRWTSLPRVYSMVMSAPRSMCARIASEKSML